VQYRYVVLALCTLAFIGTMVARLVISPVVPQITAAFSVSKAGVGLALTGMWIAYALTQFPSGVLADRFGERRIILASVGVTAVASALLAAAPNFPIFAGTAIVLGAGAGLHYSVATSFLARYFDRVGRAIGIHVSGGPIAGVVAPIAAAAVAVRYGFRPALLLGAAVAAPVFALFWLRVEPTEPAQPDTAMRSRFEIGPLRTLLSRREIQYTTVMAVGGAFCWQATASFFPAFLIEYHGLSAARASALFSAYFVVLGAAQPLLGVLSDRLGRDWITVLTFGTGVAGYGALIVGSGPALLAATPLVGVAMSWGVPVQSRFIDSLGPDERATGFGLVRTVYMTLGAFGSVVVGTISDLAGWELAFGAIVAVLAFEGLLSVALALRG
jgi:MFS family permease